MPNAPLHVPHFAPRAKRVIQLFMPGGPSHVDTFDFKPDIEKYQGQRLAAVDRKSLRNTKGGLLRSPFDFKQYGRSGKHVSSIFPHVAQCVDDICFVHSMYTDIPEHAGGILMMNTGHIQPIRPSMGSWIMYGLGSENHNLPGFISMCPGGAPRAGMSNWGNGFLPGAYAGSLVNCAAADPRLVMRDLASKDLTLADQRQDLDLLRQLNRKHLEHRHQDPRQMEASIEAMELAFRMQTAAPDAFDIRGETRQTLDMYGDSPFARGCLLSRRLVERGVRVVQLSSGGDIPWDSGHEDIHAHANLARDTDQGIAALLRDLKQRGLLDETLVVWGGEFGRAPTSEGVKGRDHNHYGYTVWMAGGGVKPGFSYGATDNFGLAAIDSRVHVHDLHATILHLMGFNHEKLTYRHSGRDYRLTDVYGKVVSDIIA